VRRIENECVDCETCTLGSGCPLLRVEVIECDNCGEPADYHIEDSDYCESCAIDYLKDLFTESFSVGQMAEVLDCEFEDLR